MHSHPAESSQNTCDFWEIRKYCPKFYNGRLWENFFFSFWSVWDKLVIVPSFWWYIILSHSNEIRTTWRYSNKYVYLKFFTSVTFAQNKIIKISPRSSDLITMRKNNIPPKTWYNYQFVPDTSKTEKKNFLIDAHYKTLGSIFWHLKKWKYFLNFPQGDSPTFSGTFSSKNLTYIYVSRLQNIYFNTRDSRHFDKCFSKLV